MSTSTDVFGSSITYTAPATGGWEEGLAWLSMFGIGTAVVGIGIALVTLGFLYVVARVGISSWAYYGPRDFGRFITELGFQIMGLELAFLKYGFDEMVNKIDVASNKRIW